MASPFQLSIDLRGKRKDKEIEAGLRQAAKDYYDIEVPSNITGAEGVANYLKQIGPSIQAQQTMTLESARDASKAQGQARGLTEVAIPTLQGALEKFHNPETVQRALSALSTAPGQGMRPQEAGQLTLARALAASKVPITDEGFTKAVAPTVTDTNTPSVGTDREAISLELYGVPFNKLTTGQRSTVNKEEQKRAISISSASAGGRTEASGQAKLDLPLTAEEATDLVNPEDLSSPPPGLTQRQAIEKGFRSVTQEQRVKLAANLQTKALVDTITGLADRLITAKDAVEANIQGARLTTGAFTRANQEASAYNDSKQAVLGVISRNLGGERGVLTDRDIERVAKWMPGFRDTKGIKDFKIGMIKFLLDTAIESNKRAALGLAPDPEYRKKLDSIFTALELGAKSTEENKAGGIEKEQSKPDPLGIR